MEHIHDHHALFSILNGIRRPRAWFFDLDGTLLTLAPTPQAVVVPPRLVEALYELGQREPVAVVSGRALKDLEHLLNGSTELPVYLSGNHGQEIRGPNHWRYLHPSARTFQTQLERLGPEIQSLVRDVPGVQWEDKTYTATLHYRNAPSQAHPLIVRKLREILAPYPDVALSAAKMAWEIRPRSGATKADAVGAILDHLGAPSGRITHWHPIIFGDDRTDQDAFLAFFDQAVTCAVGPLPLEGARYRVDSPEVVRAAVLLIAKYSI